MTNTYNTGKQSKEKNKQVQISHIFHRSNKVNDNNNIKLFKLEKGTLRSQITTKRESKTPKNTMRRSKT